MVARRTYIVSLHEHEDHLLLEEVRTRRRVRLADLSEISGQIARWLAEESAPEPGAPPTAETAS
jgi:hypothetical protein